MRICSRAPARRISASAGAWFEALAATVLGHGERLAIAGVEADTPPGMPLACLVGRHRERDPAFFGARSFTSLSNYYTLRYAPLVDGGDSRAAWWR